MLRGGTLAAAAAEANLTPSAVSMQMKQLEAWLGQPLFDRSGLQVRPTRLAHEVGALMREALGSWRRCAGGRRCASKASCGWA